MVEQLIQDTQWCQSTSVTPPQLLSHPGSMTEKLGELSGQKPLILNLDESIEVANPKDCLSLGEPMDGDLWQRKIILGNEQPWLLGYSLARPCNKTNPLHPLQTMGTKPLGNKLFASQEVWRVSYQTGFVGAENGIWQVLKDWLPDIEYKLWARRSLFNFHGEALLIYEVFLPTCPGFDYPYA